MYIFSKYVYICHNLIQWKTLSPQDNFIASIPPIIFPWIFLNKMIAEKKKQIRFRKWFYNQLKRLSLTVFETEDEEYEAIQKYGRGIWETTQYDKTFSKDDLIIIGTIAQDFVAFIK